MQSESHTRWMFLPPRYTGDPPAWQYAAWEMLGHMQQVSPIEYSILYQNPLNISPGLAVDLQTIEHKLRFRQYLDPEELQLDLCAVFNGCSMACGADVQKSSMVIEELFSSRWEKDLFLGKNVKAPQIAAVETLEEIEHYISVLTAEISYHSQKMEWLEKLRNELCNVAEDRRRSVKYGRNVPNLSAKFLTPILRIVQLGKYKNKEQVTPLRSMLGKDIALVNVPEQFRKKVLAFLETAVEDPERAKRLAVELEKTAEQLKFDAEEPVMKRKETAQLGCSGLQHNQKREESHKCKESVGFNENLAAASSPRPAVFWERYNANNLAASEIPTPIVPTDQPTAADVELNLQLTADESLPGARSSQPRVWKRKHATETINDSTDSKRKKNLRDIFFGRK